MSLLIAKDLTVELHRKVVLRGVTLSVAAGEFVGLAGPNGAGKTTFLRAAAGLVRKSGGELLIDGKPLDGRGRKTLARTVAYLAHGAPAHWPMPAESVVALGRLPHANTLGLLRDHDHEVVAAAMQQAEAADLANRPITELSEGERARVMIARALAQEPKLLLADEPTAALDPYHQLRVLEILRGIAARGGAVLAVFHDLPLAMRYCTRLALLVEGRILAEGAPADVVTADNVRATYGVEMHAGPTPTFALPYRP